jgi:hypothetical protein
MDVTGADRLTQVSKRRCRFSLRMLFATVLVGGLFLGWLGANFKTVRDRQLIWQDLNANGVVLTGGLSAPVELIQSADELFQLSTTRVLLGDIVYTGTLYFPHRPAAEADIARAAYFPELNAFIDAPEGYSE